MSKTREFLLFSDCTMANPNGDLINDNRPRQDESTGILEMSDVRIKRYVRDEWLNKGKKVFVRPVKNENGKFIDCKGVAAKVIEDENIKSEELEQTLKNVYIDVKLFGAVITDPKFNIVGPLQIMWSKSVHAANVEFAQGTSVFTSKSEADQGTIWSKYYTPYALFKTYMLYNEIIAKKQNINISEEDIESFIIALIDGIKNYRSTSKNQMPRLLVELIYKDNTIDGELNYVNTNYDVQANSLRNIQEVKFDLKPLVDYYSLKSEHIEKINIYKHHTVNLENVDEVFNIKEI